MSGNSLDNKNDFNYQQELSRFLHTVCGVSVGRIMKKNQIRFSLFGSSLWWGISKEDM